MKRLFLNLVMTLLISFGLVSCLGETTSPRDLSVQATAEAVAEATVAAMPSATVEIEALDSMDVSDTATVMVSAATDEPEVVTDDQNKKTNPSKVYGLGDFDVGMNPLTGLIVENPANLDRRPVSVKINNYPRSNRPQWGLSLADIVYEFYHNNNLPRFHAVFYGNNAELVGPIRSGRMFDRFLVDIYESQFLFAMADSHIIQYFESLDAAPRYGYPLDGECPPDPVCRYEPETLNYLLGDTAEVAEFNAFYGADDERPVLDGMGFSFAVPGGGEDLYRLYLKYSYSAYSYWEYDAKEANYVRYQDQQEAIGAYPEEYAILTDRLTEDEIRTANVVVLFVEHFHRFFKPGDETTPPAEIVDMNFVGEGKAFGLRDGEVYPLIWTREDGEMVQLSFEDGSPYAFKPGKTWFEVMSTESLTEMEDEVWRIIFKMTQPYEEDLVGMAK